MQVRPDFPPADAGLMTLTGQTVRDDGDEQTTPEIDFEEN
jgi:hypothetical protein